MAIANKQPLTPIILALDTAGDCGSVALVAPGRCLAEYSLTTSVTHSRKILTGIDELLTETSLNWSQIDGLAVSIGPGSFTGLRIGLSTAKGLAMAAAKPLIGIPTLDALAVQVPFHAKQICALTDARKKEVYCAFYLNDCSGLNRTSDYQAIKPEKLIAAIDRETVFIGDGLQTYGELLKEKLGEKAIMAPLELFFQRAAAVGHLGIASFKQQNFLDPASASPIYVRASEAELLFGPAITK